MWIQDPANVIKNTYSISYIFYRFSPICLEWDSGKHESIGNLLTETANITDVIETILDVPITALCIISNNWRVQKSYQLLLTIKNMVRACGVISFDPVSFCFDMSKKKQLFEIKKTFLDLKWCLTNIKSDACHDKPMLLWKGFLCQLKYQWQKAKYCMAHKAVTKVTVF